MSRSGHYAARCRASEPEKVCVVTPHLKAAFAESGRSYGSRRLNQIPPVWKRKFIHLPHSQHGLPVARNTLGRQFQPDAPNVAWVSDITYIRTRGDWLYLAAVMDLYSRKIVGWAMAPHMEAEWVCSALRMAIA